MNVYRVSLSGFSPLRRLFYPFHLIRGLMGMVNMINTIRESTRADESKSFENTYFDIRCTHSYIYIYICCTLTYALIQTPDTRTILTVLSLSLSLSACETALPLNIPCCIYHTILLLCSLPVS